MWFGLWSMDVTPPSVARAAPLKSAAARFCRASTRNARRPAAAKRTFEWCGSQHSCGSGPSGPPPSAPEDASPALGRSSMAHCFPPAASTSTKATLEASLAATATRAFWSLGLHDAPKAPETLATRDASPPMPLAASSLSTDTSLRDPLLPPAPAWVTAATGADGAAATASTSGSCAHSDTASISRDSSRYCSMTSLLPPPKSPVPARKWCTSSLSGAGPSSGRAMAHRARTRWSRPNAAHSVIAAHQ
mmetsp:Transcript_46684/g.143967  ORF Transcript_46684/g.143967 Transcript_46684/m.143967 type:complete len:248 (+) Transcript_46684:207-950(+)